MSGTFDSLQRAIETHPDHETRTRLRFAVDALHRWDHRHDGVLNRILEASKQADLAEKAAIEYERRLV